MHTLKIGDVTITSIIERDGPWRKTKDMFPAYDPEAASASRGARPVVYEPASGKMVIPYQTFVVRTPQHTMLIDTCTGEDKGYPAPWNFPKRPWLDGFRAARLEVRRYRLRVLHAPAHRPYRLEHDAARRALGPDLPAGQIRLPQARIRRLGAGTQVRANRPAMSGRSTAEPIVAAGQALLVDDNYQLDDTVSLSPTPGHSPCHCCVNIRSGGQHAIVTGDMMHHALQCREPDWSTIFDWDAKAGGADSRRKFLGEVAGTGTLVLPIHFPNPTAGRVRRTASVQVQVRAVIFPSPPFAGSA